MKTSRSFLRPVALVAVPVVALAVGISACSSSSSKATTTSVSTAANSSTTVLGQNPAASAFYQPPDPLPKGKPGEIIRSQPLTNVPAGSKGWRVLYHSTGLHGEDIAVSGMVIVPEASSGKNTTTTTSSASSPSTTGSSTGGDAATAPTVDPTDRPIVSWAHPTTGVADTCAPSVLPNGPTLVAGLQGFLDAGYVVAATDYQGLGTPGVHPYLVGISEGRGVLDAARAAQNLKGTGAGKSLFTWGHSQGGQGSLFAGQLAKSYAPEFDFKGSAAAAPAGELAAVFDLDVNTVDGVVLGGWAMNAYYQTYKDDHPDMSLDQIVTAEGRTALPSMLPLCDVISDQFAQLAGIALPLVGKFYATSDPSSVPPWGGLLEQNSPGATKTDAPFFIAQDTADQVVPAATTDKLVAHLCSIGDTVDSMSFPGLSHDVIGTVSAPDALAWMQNILAGRGATTTCTPPSEVTLSPR